jgi:exonuclease VII large subunit
MLKLVCALIAGLLIGFAIGEWRHSPESASTTTDISSLAAELREAQAQLASKIGDQLTDMRRHIDELPAFTRSATPTREPAATSTSVAPAVPNDLDLRIAELEQQLAALTKAIEAHQKLVLYPKVEEMRAARKTVDRALIAQVSETLVRDREAAFNMVRYLTFAEVLERFGAPTGFVEEGAWYYERPQGQTLGPESFHLYFVNGYVVGASSSDDR